MAARAGWLSCGHPAHTRGTSGYRVEPSWHVLRKILQVLVILLMNDEHSLAASGLAAHPPPLTGQNASDRVVMLSQDYFIAGLEHSHEFAQPGCGLFNRHDMRHLASPVAFTLILNLLSLLIAHSDQCRQKNDQPWAKVLGHDAVSDTWL